MVTETSSRDKDQFPVETFPGDLVIVTFKRGSSRSSSRCLGLPWTRNGV